MVNSTWTSALTSLVNVCHRLGVTDVDVYRLIVLRDFRVTLG